MLHYPKIPSSKSCRLGPCVVFEKIDGTNLHWDWERDYGWHAFGTRRDAFNLTERGILEFDVAHPNLIGAADLFSSSLATPLAQALEALGPQRVSAFTEYVGAHSFAGNHHSQEPKTLVLFDVQWDGQMLGPERFLEHFSHLSIPRVLYRGKFHGQLLEDVYQGKFGVSEGVVVKGGEGSDLWMAKVKTKAYEARLQDYFGSSWQDYWE